MSSSAEQVEVFAGIQRRRRYTAEEKMAIVHQASQTEMTTSSVARRHGIAPTLVFGWRRRMNEGGKEAIRADHEVVESCASGLAEAGSGARAGHRQEDVGERDLSRACKGCPQ